jgi:hypothetical protein
MARQRIPGGYGRLAVDSTVYDELFDLVPRDKIGEVSVSERLHHMRLFALVHARAWAEQVGITFQWAKAPDAIDDACWTVWAVLDGDRFEWSDGWCFDKSPDSSEPAEVAGRLWAEGDLSCLILSSIDPDSSRDDNCNHRLQTSPDGGIIWDD